MKTVTECVNQLKRNLQALNGTIVLTQSYEGLDVPIMEDDDSKQALLFSESLQQKPFQADEKTFNNPYSKRALQAAWNFADILSIALTYTPKEFSVGISIGLFAEGANKKWNGSLLIDSINYIDSKNMLPTPYIIDDVTNSINLYLIDFINNVRKTNNGKSLFKSLTQICNIISPQPMSIDEMIINIAKERVDVYKSYKNSLSSALELSDEEEEDIFFDAIDDELEFYDTKSSPPYNDIIKEQVKRRINTLHLTIDLLFEIEKQQSNHRTDQSKTDDQYCSLLSCLSGVKELTMNPQNDLKSIGEHILNNEQLKTAFQELPDTANQRVRIVDYLKKCLNDLLELCGFGRPFVERQRYGLTLFDTYKKQIKDTLDRTDKTECSYQLETRI